MVDNGYGQIPGGLKTCISDRLKHKVSYARRPIEANKQMEDLSFFSFEVRNLEAGICPRSSVG